MFRKTLLASLTLLALCYTRTAAAYCSYELVCDEVCQWEATGWSCYWDVNGSYSCELEYGYVCEDDCQYQEVCDPDPDPDPGPDPDPDPNAYVGYMECTTTQVSFGNQGTYPGLTITAFCTNICEVYCDGSYSHQIVNDWHVCEDWECYDPYGAGGCSEVFPITASDGTCN